VTERSLRLSGTSWVLVSLEGAPVLPGTEITAAFGTDRRVSGSSGCNRYVGAYEVGGPGLEVGPLATTRMFCGDPGVMDQEQRYLSALQGAALAAVEGGQLLVTDGAGRRDLLFVTAAPEAG
jgi:heat shock protein HslJ